MWGEKLRLKTGLRIIVAVAVTAVTLGQVYAPAPAQAATGINAQINYQARILNSSDVPVTDGNYNVQFKIYSGGDGVLGGGDETLLWTESHLNSAGTGLPFKNGYLTTQLGSITSLAGVDFNNDTLWLSTNIGTTSGSCTPFTACAPDGEMSPFKRFSTSPYAFNAGQLGGITSAGFAQINPASAQAGSLSVTGSVAAATSLQAPLVDTATAVALNLGTTTASAVTVGRSAAALTLQGNAATTFRATSGTFTTTVGFATPTANNAITFPNAGGTVCTTTATTCSATYQAASATGYLVKNAAETSVASVLGPLLGLTNSNTGAAGVLSLNGAGTNSALSIVQSGNPAAGQALILANNTATTPSGNLIDLQANNASRFSVTSGGAVSTTGTINGQTISAAAASFTGSVTAATSFLGSLLDASSAGVFSIGTTNATSIALNQNVTVATGKGIATTGSTAASTTFSTQVAGDTNARLGVGADGRLLFGSGAAASDVSLSRSAAGTLGVAGILTVTSTATNAPAFSVQAPTGMTTDIFRVGSNGGNSFGVNSTANPYSNAGLQINNGGLNVQGSQSTNGINAGLVLVNNTGAQGNSASRGVIIRANSAQAANTFEVQDASGFGLSAFGATGQLTLGRSGATGTLQNGTAAFVDGSNANGFSSTVATGALTASQTITLGNQSGTVCLQTSASCGFVAGAAANFIQNTTTQQASSNFNVSGTGAVGTGFTVNAGGIALNASGITSTGAISGATTYAGNSIALTTTNNSVATLSLTNKVGQTSNLFQAIDTSGNKLAQIGANGTLTLGTVGALLGGASASSGTILFGDGTTDGFTATLKSNVLTANRNLTLPDLDGTLCTTATCTTGSAAGFIQNQAAVQQSAVFNIAGSDLATVTAQIQGPANATASVAIVKGGATPTTTANILDTQLASGASQFKVAYNGVVTSSQDINALNNLYVTNNSSAGSFLVSAGGGVQHNSGTGTKLSFAANGPAQFTNSSVATQTTLVIKQAAGQTADLFQIQDASANVVFRGTAGGILGSGDTTTASTASGAVTLRSGNATGTASNSGSVVVDAGTATGTVGSVNVGGTNASAVNIGRSGTATPTIAIQGAAATSSLVFYNAGGTASTTLNFATPASSTTTQFSNAGGTVCTTVTSTCSTAYQTSGTSLQKNVNAQEASASTFAGYQYKFTQNSTAAGAGVLSIINSGTSAALNVSQLTSPAAGQAAVLVNAASGVSGNLLDLQLNAASKFKVDTNGAVTTGTINGQTLGSATSLTGTLTVATGVTVTTGGLTVSGGGATITGVLSVNSSSLNSITGGLSLTGGLSNNTAGITGAGAISGASTIAANGTVTLSGTGANQLAVSGAPLASATSSLVQLGSVISGGNAAANGGTYFGLNAPAAGAGSAADFLNLQLGGVAKLVVTNAGNVTAGTYNGQTIGAASSFTGTVNVATGYQIGTAAASGAFLRGNGTNFVSGTIQATDIPTGSTFYIQNQTAVAQVAAFNINGAGTFGAALTVTAGGASVTGNSTITGTLGGLTGLTVASGGASVTGGVTVLTGALTLTNGGIASTGAIAGATSLTFVGAAPDITGARNVTASGQLTTPLLSSADGSASSNVVIKSGTATGGTSGNVSLDAGTATTTAGAVNVGTGNASAVNVGRTGAAFALQGSTASSIVIGNGSTTTLQFAAPTANVTYTLGSGTAGSYAVCTTLVTSCSSVYQASGAYLNRNAADTSSASFAGYLYSFANTDTTASGALSLTSAGTSSALKIVASNNPTTGQALISANNTAAGATGNLLDLQVGGTSKLSVSAAGSLTSGTVNGQTISSAAQFTGTVTAATGVTVTTGGLTVAAGGVTVTTGGISNNNGGVSGIGAVTGASTLQFATTGSIDSAGASAISIGTGNASGVTIGRTGGSFAIQGSTSSTLAATSGAFTTTVGFANPTASTVFQFGAVASGSTYQICSTYAATCGSTYAAYYANGYVQLAPATAQADATTNTSLFINKTAGTSLVNLQASSSTVFSVQTNGNLTSTGTATLGNGVVTVDTAAFKVRIGSGTPNQGAGTLANAGLYVTGTTELDGLVFIGDTTNNVAVDATTHEVTFSGSARHAKAIRLTAEYAGAVLDADGTTNTGTMTASYDATQRMGYYKWTTSQTSAQNYDVVVNVPLPDDFAAWSATAPTVMVYRTAAGSTGTMTVTRTDGTANFTALALTPAALNAWSNVTTTALTGTYAAGGTMTMRFHLTAPTNQDFRLGDIVLPYYSKY